MVTPFSLKISGLDNALIRSCCHPSFAASIVKSGFGDLHQGIVCGVVMSLKCVGALGKKDDPKIRQFKPHTRISRFQLLFLG
jgi:hypothetical protein